MGINGNTIIWIENYLNGRIQKTICNNELSNANNVICGVPQGSILGPLLFLVYINDMEKIFHDVNFQLYADDTVIYCSGLNGIDVEKKLQLGVDIFIKWCNCNQLTINIKKTKVMMFGSRYNINKNNNLKININKETIQAVPTYKYLGVHLDQTLSFNYHLKNLINKISQKMYVFSKIRRFLNEKTSIIVYKSMILPFFDYADAIFMFSNEKLLYKLDRLHTRGLKLSKNIFVHIEDSELFNLCNISNSSNRRMVHLRNFLFNRKYLCESNQDLDSQICTRAKSGPLFHLYKPNCESYKRSVCYSGFNEWNKLSSDLRNIENIIEFKKKQKTWLLDTYKL